MGQSARESATRAFVSVLLLLARSCELALAINRNSSEPELLKAYRKLLLKVHPDKGGKESDQRRLQEAKERWETAPLSRRLLFSASFACCLAWLSDCRTQRAQEQEDHKPNAGHKKGGGRVRS